MACQKVYVNKPGMMHGLVLILL